MSGYRRLPTVRCPPVRTQRETNACSRVREATSGLRGHVSACVRMTALGPAPHPRVLVSVKIQIRGLFMQVNLWS